MMLDISASFTSWSFISLPGNTSYSVTVVAIYPGGQRVPSFPVSGFLPGYGNDM